MNPLSWSEYLEMGLPEGYIVFSDYTGDGDKVEIIKKRKGWDVPNQVEFLEIVSVGENYSIAKSDYGAVYIPRAAMNYLDRNGGCEVGAKLDGEIGFTPGKGRFHWRLVPNGVTYTYAE